MTKILGNFKFIDLCRYGTVSSCLGAVREFISVMTFVEYIM